MEILVGTYSFSYEGVEGNGEGIYSVPFNNQAGSFGTPKLMAKCVNPSSLALSPNGMLLFANRESFAKDGPALASFRVSVGGTLTALSQLPIAGELPCHLAFDPVQKRLASAQYWTGNVAISSVEDGVLQLPNYFTYTGHGPNAGRQDGPHAHYVVFTNEGEVLHLVDLGSDSIVSHQLGSDGNAIQTTTLNVPAGSGPRHMVLNRAETYAWVLCELDESLIMLKRNGLGWAIDNVQPGFEALESGDGSCAAIRLSPEETHVYISGRHQSQIAGFTTNGMSVGTFDCGGICPRDLNITPDGNWIISANQNSNTLTSLRRNPMTGTLNLSGFSCSIGSPVALIAR